MGRPSKLIIEDIPKIQVLLLQKWTKTDLAERYGFVDLSAFHKSLYTLGFEIDSINYVRPIRKD